MINKEIAGISIQIAKDMKYSVNQINTVYLIDTPPSILVDNLGASFQDYLDGFFWSRDWINSGSNPDTMKAQFPILFVESVGISIDNISSPDIQRQYAFVFIDKVECESCPDKDSRTGQTVKDNLLETIRIFLKELYDYEKWYIDFDGTTTERWVSKGRLEFYKDIDTITALSFVEDLAGMIESSNFDIREWGNIESMRGYIVEIPITYCKAITTNFDYSKQDASKTGIAICC